MRIYLAGPFAPYKFKGKKYGDWRDFVLQEIKETEDKNFYNPMKDSRELCPATYTMDDALGVLRCDCILHFRMKGQEEIGGSWELGIAFATNLIKKRGKTEFPEKLIINVDETNCPWPLNSASSSINFSNLNTAIKFLKEIKSLEKWEWMKVYNKLIHEDRAGK